MWAPRRAWYLLRVTPSTRPLGAALGALCVLLLGGCAGTQDEPATDAAQELLDSARDGDGARACDLLAPATRSELESSSGSPCEEAILEEDLGEGTGDVRVEVYDTSAQVKVGGDTVFLSRFDGRWLVVAAACTAVPARPYDCSVGLP